MIIMKETLKESERILFTGTKNLSLRMVKIFNILVNLKIDRRNEYKIDPIKDPIKKAFIGSFFVYNISD